MSTPEPPGGERDRQDGSDDAQAIEASFAEIVAAWGADEPRWPDEEPASPEPEEPSPAEVANEDEGHYVPPEPPPLPRPRAATVGAIVMLAIGLLLLLLPQVIGLTDAVGLPLGLIAVASGLFWLFLMLRTGPPTDSGGDDGSRL